MAKTKEPTTKELAKPEKKVRQRRNQVTKGDHGGAQILLLDDVVHVGKQGEVVEVKAGYARNFLIPNGLAILPSEHNMKRLDKFKVRVTQMRESRVADLKSVADQIGRTKSVTIEANANETGDLYGSVGPQEICRALRGKNLQVEPEMIHLPEPLRHCGIYPDVHISLGYDIQAVIEVTIIPAAAGKKK